jgi:xylulokinase
MRDGFLIGIDCGTSYSKVGLYSSARGLRRTLRSSSPISHPPSLHIDPLDWWNTIVRLLREIVSEPFAKQQVSALCITTISPVLTIFDPSDPDRAIGISYERAPKLDGCSSGLERTLRRVDHLVQIAIERRFRSVALTDLTGYLNYRLTGTLTLNAAAAAELEVSVPEVLDSGLPRSAAIPLRIAGPASMCGSLTKHGSSSTGIPVGTRVCFGATDSLAAVLESGARTKKSLMLYLGTFGSLLEVRAQLSPSALLSANFGASYRWMLSVPNFGPMVELAARRYAGSEDLKALDRLAGRAPAGAEGLFLKLPLWDGEGRTQGSVGFRTCEGRELHAAPSLRSRASLESLGYLVRSFKPSALEEVRRLHVSGGGARSQLWLQVLADVLGKPIVVPEHPGQAAGAAYLAAIACGSADLWDADDTVQGLDVMSPRPALHRLAQATQACAERWYREQSGYLPPG